MREIRTVRWDPITVEIMPDTEVVSAFCNTRNYFIMLFMRNYLFYQKFYLKIKDDDKWYKITIARGKFFKFRTSVMTKKGSETMKKIVAELFEVKEFTEKKYTKLKSITLQIGREAKIVEAEDYVRNFLKQKQS